MASQHHDEEREWKLFSNEAPRTVQMLRALLRGAQSQTLRSQLANLADELESLLDEEASAEAA